MKILLEGNFRFLRIDLFLGLRVHLCQSMYDVYDTS